MSSRLGRSGAAAFIVVFALLLGHQLLGNSRPPTGNRVTILYDAFGRPSQMIQDWGYSALVEYAGKRILFDIGNNPTIFARNVKTAGVDLRKLDFVVLSHRHLDHTASLNHLLSLNPDVKIYVPRDGVFGGSIPSKFYRRQDSLPEEMRYFAGKPSEPLTSGVPWLNGKFVMVDSTLEVIPGVHLIPLISESVGTKELPEISMAVETPGGLVVVAGCSHPGIERIVAAAARIQPRVYSVLGGLHLPSASDTEIARVAAALHDTYKVEHIAPGHCTGEPAFYHFKKTWKERYTYAGLGTVISLP
jgi:7,8-dihydropterin-6-yl-methyl-4-(beta-D-ribofuranosyl)aminobenzene 5'-phosphate synthase